MRPGAAESGRLCAAVQGPALSGLHPSAARPADHRGQAGRAVDERAGDGYGESGIPGEPAAPAGGQGHHRHPGQLYGAVRGGRGEGQGAGETGGGADGL